MTNPSQNFDKGVRFSGNAYRVYRAYRVVDCAGGREARCGAGFAVTKFLPGCEL